MEGAYIGHFFGDVGDAVESTDWANELLRWTQPDQTNPPPNNTINTGNNTNYEDIFSLFPGNPGGDTSNNTPAQRSTIHVTGDITGDLDRDLGFNVDEVFLVNLD
ncbi:hypothetical protein BO71DRAFT_424655 [Aspergillus ellipticus CBS 707.79]|uniref:Uncharacterized protein n=1 Tax=Aspergillus ellipticus CBS 707.79 TaxID=1448320 RepID=A0A319DQX5_9EURO|nr:hypothetical protein BO71DRAFT_424655 [Aspergillus ellipticus CBS 707.79]